MEASSKSAYLSDYWTLRDDLRFSDFRPALKSILIEAQTPLTLGIYGTWGSGKTSLMKMLREDVQKERLHSVRTIWFTAWKYVRHEALWRAFILHVLNELFQIRDLDEEKRILLSRMEESVHRPVDWQELGRWTVNWWQLVKEGGKGAAELAAAFLPGGGFIKVISNALETFRNKKEIVDNFEKAAAAVHREVQKYHREQIVSMEQFEETFREALGKVLGKNGRLIVFVDDLDRCLPEKAIEVLEAIKLFLEVPGTVFVLGMDLEVIERAVEAYYGAIFSRDTAERRELPIKGSEYLQKIVQIPFPLPPLVQDDLLGFIQSIERDTSGQDRMSSMTMDVLSRGVYPNPRQVKRAVNIFRLLRQVALTREEVPRDKGGIERGGIAWPLLAKTVLIQTQWPELYREWRARPTLVQTLEEEYTRKPTTEEEIERGRMPSPESTEKGLERVGGILGQFLSDRPRYHLLEVLLRYPPPEATGEGRERARFSGLKREEMSPYIRLAGMIEKPEPIVEAPADFANLKEEIISGDWAKAKEALSILEEKEKDPEGPKHKLIRGELLKAISDSSRPAKLRIVAGDSLSELGDPRIGVGVDPQTGLPNLVWCEVPAGPFRMGTNEEDIPALIQKLGGEADWYKGETPQQEINLSPFYISRYPVTHSQFKAFVKDKGYHERRYWTKEGWGFIQKADQEARKGPKDFGTPFNFSNHPIVGVSWYEALAFTKWINEKSQVAGFKFQVWRNGQLEDTILKPEAWHIRLPTEEEWEKAARGTDGRVFPWGPDPDPNKANYNDTGIGTTSAVGSFPLGESPYGALDMSGNVWEWCQTKWRGSYKTKADGSLEGADPRVVRGGSWHYGPRGMRCACRGWDGPDDRDPSMEFRVVFSPGSP